MFWLSYECFSISYDAFLLKVSFPPAITAVAHGLHVLKTQIAQPPPDLLGCCMH